MKRTETIERTICDVCKVNPAWDHRGCMNCGKHMCSDCEKTHQIVYPRAIFFQSSEDGRYCTDCNTQLIANPSPLFTAYRLVAAQRAEYKAWMAEFEPRNKAAEKRVEELKAKYKVPYV